MRVEAEVGLQGEGPGPAHNESPVHAVRPLGPRVGVPVVGAGLARFESGVKVKGGVGGQIVACCGHYSKNSCVNRRTY